MEAESLEAAHPMLPMLDAFNELLERHEERLQEQLSHHASVLECTIQRSLSNILGKDFAVASSRLTPQKSAAAGLVGSHGSHGSPGRMPRGEKKLAEKKSPVSKKVAELLTTFDTRGRRRSSRLSQCVQNTRASRRSNIGRPWPAGQTAQKSTASPILSWMGVGSQGELTSKTVLESAESQQVPWWRGSHNPRAFSKRKMVDGEAGAGELIRSKGWVAGHSPSGSKGWWQHFDFSQVTTPLSKAYRLHVLSQKSRLQRFVLGAHFDCLCGFIIALNAVLFAYQTQYMADNHRTTVPNWSSIASVCFTSWYVLEVMVRLGSSGCAVFFTKRDCYWNWLDVVIVSLSLIETVLNALTASSRSSQFGVVRLLRILKFVRVLRVIRVVRFFSHLRVMVNSSFKAVKPFLWALSFLLLLIFMVSLHLTQASLEWMHEHPEEKTDKMEKLFGTLHGSMLTLFQSISGGLSWHVASDELCKIHWLYGILLSVFVSFAVFAVLNIVTGIFVENAIRSVQEDQDVIIAEEMSQENSNANKVLRIFQEADTDRTGSLDVHKLAAHMKDHRVRAYLHHLGLDIDEAVGLFRLLDISGEGEVDSRDFLLGCMRLKGPAKNVDVATLLYENKRMMEIWGYFMEYCEQEFDLLLGRNDNELSSESGVRIGQKSTSTSPSVGWHNPHVTWQAFSIRKEDEDDHLDDITATITCDSPDHAEI